MITLTDLKVACLMFKDWFLDTFRMIWDGGTCCSGSPVLAPGFQEGYSK